MARTPRDPERGAARGGSGTGMSGYHRTVLVLIVLVLLGSIGARAWYARSDDGVRPTAGRVGSAGGQGFLAGDSEGGATGESSGGPVRSALPAVTEASFFALIGFALGYTTKKIVKLGLLLVALAFVAVQLLVHLGMLEVDWNAVVAKLNELVLNVRQNGTVQELVADRVPTAGGLGAGWLLGLRRG